MTGGLAWAEDRACVEAFRSDYVELGRTNDLRYQETAELYSIYFDHVNELSSYRSESQRKMAELLKEKLEDGSACNFLGWPRRKHFFNEQYAKKYSEVLEE